MVLYKLNVRIEYKTAEWRYNLKRRRKYFQVMLLKMDNTNNAYQKNLSD